MLVGIIINLHYQLDMSMNIEINYKNNPLNGVGLKNLLIEIVGHYDFEILFAYLNINCFKTNPSIESSVKFFDRLYVMLDIEKNDHVDLRDLLNALVQTLNVNDAQKAAFFFNLYDFDGSGTMDADELLRIILEGQERSGQEAEAFLGMLKKFDTNGDNAIDCGEFRDTILQNPEQFLPQISIIAHL